MGKWPWGKPRLAGVTETIEPTYKVEDEPYSETAWDSVSDWSEDCREWNTQVTPTQREADGE